MSRSFRCLLLVAVAATATACSSTAPSAPLTPGTNAAFTNDQPTPSSAGQTPRCNETETCVAP